MRGRAATAPRLWWAMRGRAATAAWMRARLGPLKDGTRRRMLGSASQQVGLVNGARSVVGRDARYVHEFGRCGNGLTHDADCIAGRMRILGELNGRAWERGDLRRTFGTPLVCHCRGLAAGSIASVADGVALLMPISRACHHPIDKGREEIHRESIVRPWVRFVTTWPLRAPPDIASDYRRFIGVQF